MKHVLLFFLCILCLDIAELKECPPKFKAVQDYCFYFSVEHRNWLDAGRYCYAINSKLVSIDTPEKSLHINLELLYKNVNTSYWTSGTDIGTEGNFRWTTSTRPFQFSLWCEGEPNNYGIQNCLRLVHTSHYSCWDDVNCDGTRPFICEI